MFGPFTLNEFSYRHRIRLLPAAPTYPENVDHYLVHQPGMIRGAWMTRVFQFHAGRHAASFDHGGHVLGRAKDAKRVQGINYRL